MSEPQDRRPGDGGGQGDLYYEGATEVSTQREDERWSSANQARDWMYLIAFSIIQFTWMMVVFLLEPGIR